MTKCIICNNKVSIGGCADDLYFKDGDKQIERIKNDTRESCVECGCPDNTFHHAGCDKEKCPVCSSPIFECNCLPKFLYETLDI